MTTDEIIEAACGVRPEPAGTNGTGKPVFRSGYSRAAVRIEGLIKERRALEAKIEALEDAIDDMAMQRDAAVAAVREIRALNDRLVDRLEGRR